MRAFFESGGVAAIVLWVVLIYIAYLVWVMHYNR